MSILDNEGHDPTGLGNMPSMTERMKLRAALRHARACLRTVVEPDMREMDDEDIAVIRECITECDAALGD